MDGPAYGVESEGKERKGGKGPWRQERLSKNLGNRRGSGEKGEAAKGDGPTVAWWMIPNGRLGVRESIEWSAEA